MCGVHVDGRQTGTHISAERVPKKDSPARAGQYGELAKAVADLMPTLPDVVVPADVTAHLPAAMVKTFGTRLSVNLARALHAAGAVRRHTSTNAAQQGGIFHPLRGNLQRHVRAQPYAPSRRQDLTPSPATRCRPASRGDKDAASAGIKPMSRKKGTPGAVLNTTPGKPPRMHAAPLPSSPASHGRYGTARLPGKPPGPPRRQSGRERPKRARGRGWPVNQPLSMGEF